ncbi:MAG: hypothetical protein C0443_03885 [Comamonadaceae bacterium]|nr:hypothetical protein [Comamonadaceae bacterium]
MRLVSLNTWKAEGDYPQRVRAMVDGLSALSADVIALQEDLRTADGLTHTALALGRALSMHLSWVPARAKPRRVGQHHTLTTSGLAVLSRRPVLEQRVLELPQDERDGERVAQCVRLPGAAGEGWLVNLHLTHLPDRADLRRAQLEVVLQAMGGLAAERPLVLCGDFNAEPGDPELAGFLQPGGPLVDVFAGRPKVTHLAASGQAFNLDHVFLRTMEAKRPFELGDARVALERPDQHGVMPSDHFAVCVDLA